MRVCLPLPPTSCFHARAKLKNDAGRLDGRGGSRYIMGSGNIPRSRPQVLGRGMSRQPPLGRGQHPWKVPMGQGCVQLLLPTHPTS